MSQQKKPSIRVLLVDDDDLSLSFYRQILARDYEVECAESAPEAMKILEASSIDAVFSDYMMPGPNGLWLMEQLRSRYPTIARILISGGTVPDLQTHLGTGLVQYFFAKPLVRSTFRDCMQKAGLL